MTPKLFKLGKQPPRIDERTISLRSIMRAAIKVPAEYSVDVAHPGARLRMFANDEYGCCVISGRANQTQRFELVETGNVPKILDSQVIAEYLRESGGIDSGLIMLNSLNAWRNRGWRVSGKTYRIEAFASIDPASKPELRQTVYANLGCQLGVALPATAADEIANGKPWATTTGKGSTPGSWGGHCVYVVGYTTTGPVCLTWGQRQLMTWRFYHRYVDEAYAVIDALNTTRKRRLLDAGRLRQLLARVA